MKNMHLGLIELGGSMASLGLAKVCEATGASVVSKALASFYAMAYVVFCIVCTGAMLAGVFHVILALEGYETGLEKKSIFDD